MERSRPTLKGRRRVAERQTCDIIVVGAGSAAFEAAVAARKAGAEHVVMLEKAPAAEAGGNARYSGTGFRFVHTGAGEIAELLHDVPKSFLDTMHINPYTAADFHADLDRMTRGRMDKALAEVLVSHSNRAV